MRRMMGAVLVAAVVVCAPMSGCVATGEGSLAVDQYRATRLAWSGTVAVLYLARSNGEIDDEQWRTTYQPAIARGYAVLDRMAAEPDLGVIGALEIELDQIVRDLALEGQGGAS